MKRSRIFSKLTSTMDKSRRKNLAFSSRREAQNRTSSHGYNNSNNQQHRNNNNNTNTYNSALSQILYFDDDIPFLSGIQHGDVIECYSLIRNAKLDDSSIEETKSANNMNNDGFLNLEVGTNAIAFRKKPNIHLDYEELFELTLEYGPSRKGEHLSLESMPIVTNTDGKFHVYWENHGEEQLY